ncbi:CDP-glycerol glycerophosphotransferase family protein [Marinobacter sp.]|uniref:CDP-glycerol glycerophosphotransferase family protein n=1 Tax=Marinobacter sp. TaxID=50741 RepID=UPI003A8D34B0
MLSLIKASIPEILKRFLRILKRKTFDKVRKLLLIKRMRARHSQLIAELTSRKRIKVVFLVIHKSVWKVDVVYQKMARDPFFEPEILVCPYIQFGEESMLQELDQTYDYFEQRGYSVKRSLKDDGDWVQLEELQPDLVVFTNPNELTRREYYQDAYTRYLSCYVPYYYMATNHAGNPEDELDKPMLNAMWRIYWPHQHIFEQFAAVSQVRGKNSKLTGYPATEALLKGDLGESDEVWKVQGEEKKKIIYAPHHTISNDKSSLSTFLKLGLTIQQVAAKYKDSVQWSFKPHPILKSKLYLHPAWGRERTDQYYGFWSSQAYTQLDEGEYEDLFIQSDAIIHDCSSFIVEYAVTRKPALYLVNRVGGEMVFLNDFGKCAFRAYQTADSAPEINEFVLDVIRNHRSRAKHDNPCFDEYLSEFYSAEMPSDRILKDIKVALGANVC